MKNLNYKGDIIMEISKFITTMDKKTINLIKENLSKEQYDEFKTSFKNVIKTIRKFDSKTSSRLYQKLNNENIDYIFRDDKIVERTIRNINDYEFRDYNYKDVTPKDFAKDYKFCVDTYENVVNSETLAE